MLEISRQYIQDVLDGKKDAPKYVIRECERMRPIYDGESEKYAINKEKAKMIHDLLSLMIMPKGFNAGKTIAESLVGFQAFLLVTVICTVHRSDADKRRFSKMVLEICRKNAKTFIVAVIFILLFFMEPKFSKFYSVAPDGRLSREIKDMMQQIIRSSSAIESRITIRRDDMMCELTQNQFVPLNYTNSRFDGKLPSVFVADEVGALPNNYAVEAMQSGQLTIKNKLGCVISTKYPKLNNPFEDEVDYAKKVIDGLVDDEELFALLYEPDDTTNWESNDLIIRQSNPLAIEIPEVLDEIFKKRQKAIEVPAVRENFVTKHCNIIYTGVGTETYIDMQHFLKCKIAPDEFDWTGKKVYLGLDLAMTTDNCSVTMATNDTEDGSVVIKAVAFYPEGKIEEKTALEKVDYRIYTQLGYGIACGDMVVDYGVIEDYILGIEQEYGVKVVQLGYDKYNALSSVQKFEGANIETVEIKQHSAVLHKPTKWLEELVLNKKFKYEDNALLELNFQNARCVFDTNLNRYVNKKKSTGKVDMVMSTLFALTLMQMENSTRATFGAQVI